MKRTVIVQRTGESSTGTPHGLLVEDEDGGSVRFTVLGADGRKRHAAVILPDLAALTVFEALAAHVGGRKP